MYRNKHKINTNYKIHTCREIHKDKNNQNLLSIGRLNVRHLVKYPRLIKRSKTILLV